MAVSHRIVYNSRWFFYVCNSQSFDEFIIKKTLWTQNYNYCTDTANKEIRGNFSMAVSSRRLAREIRTVVILHWETSGVCNTPTPERRKRRGSRAVGAPERNYLSSRQPALLTLRPIGVLGTPIIRARERAYSKCVTFLLIFWSFTNYLLIVDMSS